MCEELRSYRSFFSLLREGHHGDDEGNAEEEEIDHAMPQHVDREAHLGGVIESGSVSTREGRHPERHGDRYGERKKASSLVRWLV